MRALALACLLLPAPLAAEVPADMVTLEVLPGWRAGEGRHVAGLRFRLAHGWKTYWRAPGSAGLAPMYDFAPSTGVASVEARWPVPEVFYQAGMRSVGYAGDVTIPLEVAVGPGPARLAGHVEIGVCDEVCVPVRMSFDVLLPEGGERDPLIVAALVDRPMTPEEAGAGASCAVEPAGDGLRLTARIDMAPLGGRESVVVESDDPSLWVSDAEASWEGSTLVARAEAFARDGGALALDRGGLRITVLGDGRAVDIRGCAAP